MDERGAYDFKRWSLVVIGLLINVCLGSIYSWSVFVGPLTKYFTDTLGQQVTASEVLLPFSVFLAFFAIAMPFAGKYIDRWGPRRVAILGGVLTGAGWLLAGSAGSVQILYIVYGVIGGIGVGITYGVPVAVAARWFPERRGLAVGLTLLGFGVSPFLTANVADIFINLFGVMQTFRIFGLGFIALIVLLSLPLAFPPAGWTPSRTPSAKGSDAPVSCELRREQMLRTPSFYGLWLCYFIGCLSGLMAISIAKPVGTELVQLESGLATVLVGFFAIFNGGGRPLFGYLADRLSPRNTALLSFLLIGVASLAIFSIQTTSVYIAAFAILWGCLGGWLAIAPTATASFFGTGDYPRCYGMVFLAYGAGAIAGPMLAGFIRTSTGTYLGVFPYVAGLSLLGLIIAFFMMRPPGMAPGRRE
ncbi:MAG: OFA family MFS transporter [Methanomicrobiales archaeon]|nr:OFA family MFS transporter [Methanomicrobiales archaeon]